MRRFFAVAFAFVLMTMINHAQDNLPFEVIDADTFLAANSYEVLPSLYASDENRLVYYFDPSASVWRSYPYPDNLETIQNVKAFDNGQFLLSFGLENEGSSDWLFDPERGISQAETVCGVSRLFAPYSGWTLYSDSQNDVYHLCHTETGEMTEALPAPVQPSVMGLDTECPINFFGVAENVFALHDYLCTGNFYLYDVSSQSLFAYGTLEADSMFAGIPLGDGYAILQTQNDDMVIFSRLEMDGSNQMHQLTQVEIPMAGGWAFSPDNRFIYMLENTREGDTHLFGGWQLRIYDILNERESIVVQESFDEAVEYPPAPLVSYLEGDFLNIQLIPQGSGTTQYYLYDLQTNELLPQDSDVVHLTGNSYGQNLENGLEILHLEGREFQAIQTLENVNLLLLNERTSGITPEALSPDNNLWILKDTDMHDFDFPTNVTYSLYNLANGELKALIPASEDYAFFFTIADGGIEIRVYPNHPVGIWQAVAHWRVEPKG